jgi:hypothetical protein
LDSLQSAPNNPNNPPEELLVFQNYPNPFNTATTIKYRIKSSSFVKLKIFDITGREVYSVKSKIRESGFDYEELVDLSGHASGIYIYQIIIKDFAGGRKRSISKRMVLLK